MQLDHGTHQDRQRVENALAGTRPRVASYRHRIDGVFKGAMDTLAHRRFAMGLERLYAHAHFIRERQSSFALFERDGQAALSALLGNSCSSPSCGPVSIW
ncbi:hypothetical protein [Paraburkholderia sp. J94]|uniref:hypothetical protein n=1 Tax=Paraburkholderia sp. J94 TaxID=2805441 RepID=UPI002AB1B094|nr:hypothetical protein [Paraburkholderia sp. J94]